MPRRTMKILDPNVLSSAESENVDRVPTASDRGLSGDEDSVNRWAWEVVLEKPSLGTTGTFYTNYTCSELSLR